MTQKDPTITVRHEWTGEEKTLPYLGRASGKLEARWPTFGPVKFDPKSGFGEKQAERWQVTEASRVELRLSEFGPRAAKPVRATKPPPPPHPKQLPLIGQEGSES